MTADELTALARSWIGVPFLHQGNNRLGCDCRGFIVGLAREAGILPADFHEVKDYGRAPTPKLKEEVAKLCVAIDRAAPASLVLIRWRTVDPWPSHVAYCTGGSLIHCYSNVRAVTEHRYGEPWLRMTDSAWALPGVSRE